MPSSQLISISSAGSGPAGNFTYKIQPSRVSKGQEVAAIRYGLWDTVPNVSAAQGTNVLGVIIAGAASSLTIPDGTYQISDINTYLSQYINSVAPGKAANLQLSVFANTYTQISATCDTTSQGYGLDLSTGTSGNFYMLLGFSPTADAGDGPGVYLNETGSTTVIFTSQSPANITLGLNSFQFALPGFIAGSVGLTPGSTTAVDFPIIYSDAWQVGPGAFQSVRVPSYVYCPVIPQSFTSIPVQIVDDTGQILDFNQQGNYYNNTSTLLLHFRDIGSKDTPLDAEIITNASGTPLNQGEVSEIRNFLKLLKDSSKLTN